jgi:hypothetical protein
MKLRHEYMQEMTVFLHFSSGWLQLLAKNTKD